MIIWCIVLTCLGIFSFLDSVLNFGILVRTIDSAMYMLVALGILVRVRALTKRRQKEELEKNNDRLRERMMEIRNSFEAYTNGEPLDELKM